MYNTLHLQIQLLQGKKRLHLPGKVQTNNYLDIKDDKHKAEFNADQGDFIIHVPKAVYGEIFPGLDFIAGLLTPKGKTTAAKGIENVSGESTDLGDENEDFDWFINQELPTVEKLPLGGFQYGFASKRSGVFKELRDELNEIIDVRNPDDKSIDQIAHEKFESESSDFDEDYYLADFMEIEHLESIMSHSPPWTKLDKSEFSKTELERIVQIGNKDLLLDKPEKHVAFMSMVDILLAYSYNHRTTLGEDTVESAWTVCKLSGTLSWLQSFQSIRGVVISFLRRSLCYPLYRNWDLSLKVVEDVQAILRKGKKQVIKCFLELHELLNTSENRYVLNQLYIEDYCIWLQKVGEKKFTSLADALQKIELSKSCVNFDLPELESAALSVQEESESVNKKKETMKELVKKVAEMKVKEEGRDSDDSDSSTCSSVQTGSSYCSSEEESDSSAADSDD